MLWKPLHIFWCTRVLSRLFKRFLLISQCRPKGDIITTRRQFFTACNTTIGYWHITILKWSFSTKKRKNPQTLILESTTQQTQTSSQGSLVAQSDTDPTCYLLSSLYNFLLLTITYCLRFRRVTLQYKTQYNRTLIVIRSVKSRISFRGYCRENQWRFQETTVICIFRVSVYYLRKLFPPECATLVRCLHIVPATGVRFRLNLIWTFMAL